MKEALLFLFLWCIHLGHVVVAFQVIKNPKGPTLYVAEGKAVSLDCQSSENFHECKWVRPSSHVCAIFNTGTKQSCNKDNEPFEPWIISKRADDICAMDLLKVGPDEVGTWSCNLNGLSLHASDTDEKSTEIKLVHRPKVTLEEPNILQVIENESKTFQCSISNGEPSPSKAVSWTLHGQGGDVLQLDSAGANSISVQIPKAWNGNMLRCSVEQTDSFGNKLETYDERTVQVVEQSDRINVLGKTARAGEFQLLSKYPSSDKIILAPQTKVKFSCTITTSWLTCNWKHPQFQVPCSIHYNDRQEHCSWTRPNGGTWTVQTESEKTCTITGTMVDPQDANEWNCHMVSFPIANLHNKYDTVQEYFRLEVITPAVLDNKQLPENIEMFEGDTKELTVSISNQDAYPMPNFEWYVGDQQIYDEKRSPSNRGSYHTLNYEAKLSHSGKKLTCKVVQIDDEGNEVFKEVSTLLRISENPNSLGMSTDILATVISVSLLVVIIALIIVTLWWSKKACFRPKKEPRRPAEDLEMDPSIGVGANFGPKKPPRFGDTQTEPLLARSDETDNDYPAARNLELILSPDELKSWSEEGPALSNSTSLSSLDTQVSEKDWLLTLRALGPKFAALAEMAEGEFSDSSSDSSRGYLESGSEV